jgi:biotin carboxyl carrier protein
MKYIVSINNSNYEVDVERGKASVVKAGESETTVFQSRVTAEAPSAATAAAPAPSKHIAEGERLTAPMPGIVLHITKNIGDSVKKGDVVIVLEAMKMESEISSPFDGTIVQIPTSRGAHVATGEVLAVIK